MLTKIEQGALCVSRSFADGDVRVMLIQIDPTNWDVTEAVVDSRQWLKLHNGQPYDILGLVGVITRLA